MWRLHHDVVSSVILQVKAAEAYCQEAAGGAAWRAAVRFTQGMGLAFAVLLCGTRWALLAKTGMAVHAGDFFTFKDEDKLFDLGFDYT